MKTVESYQLLSASPGTTRSVETVRFGIPGERPKVYIQAGLHADEAPGFVVLHHLRKLLDEAEQRDEIVGEIIVVPVANPIGLSQWRDETLHGRFDFANSVNFNRQHQDIAERIAAQLTPLLSQDAQANVAAIRKCAADILATVRPDDEAGSLKHLLISLSHDADIVLDLHCDHEALMHVYMGDALWPGGSDLAAQLGAEVILLASDSGGTPFDEANSRLWWDLADRFPAYPIPPACFAATVELRGIADTDADTVQEDARNLFYFLQRRGSIAGEAPPLPPLVHEATPLVGVDYIKASVPGIITYLKKPGDLIKKGDKIAEIINPLAADKDNSISEVRCSTDGLMFTRNVDRFARPGRIIAKVAGKKPLRETGGNLLTL